MQSYKLYIHFLILLLLIITCNNVFADNPALLTYNDTQGGFSISYPEGGILQVLSDANTREISILTPENVTILSITVDSSDNIEDNLTDLLNNSISSLTGSKILQSGSDVLGGNNASHLEYEWTLNKTPLRSNIISTVKDGKKYTISYDNRAISYDDEKLLIDKIVNSFIFIPRENSAKYLSNNFNSPGVVYNSNGMPITQGDYSWNPYAFYGWDGAYGYMFIYPGGYSFPTYDGYNTFSNDYTQSPQIASSQLPSGSVTTEKPITTNNAELKEKFDSLLDLGYSYMTKSEYKRAADAFSKAIDIDPSSFKAHFGYASALFLGYDGEKDKEALNEVKQAISYGEGVASEDQLSVYYRLKASILNNLDEYDEALKAIEYSINHTTDKKRLASFYFTKAIILYDAGTSIDEVLKAAEMAVTLDATEKKYKDFVKKVADEVGGISSSSSPSTSNSNPVLNSGSTDELKSLLDDGDKYLYYENYEKAADSYLKAIKIDPSSYKAHVGYARALFFLESDSKDGNEALTEIEKGISLAKNKVDEQTLAEYYSFKACILWDLERYEEALDAIEYSISHESDKKELASYYIIKAWLLYKNNESADSVMAAIQQVINLDPTNKDYQSLMDLIKGKNSSVYGDSSVYPSATPVKVTSEKMKIFNLLNFNSG